MQRWGGRGTEFVLLLRVYSVLLTFGFYSRPLQLLKATNSSSDSSAGVRSFSADVLSPNRENTGESHIDAPCPDSPEGSTGHLINSPKSSSFALCWLAAVSWWSQLVMSALWLWSSVFRGGRSSSSMFKESDCLSTVRLQAEDEGAVSVETEPWRLCSVSAFNIKPFRKWLHLWNSLRRPYLNFPGSRNLWGSRTTGGRVASLCCLSIYVSVCDVNASEKAENHLQRAALYKYHKLYMYTTRVFSIISCSFLMPL